MSESKTQLYDLINKLGVVVKDIPENLSDVTEEFSFILGSGDKKEEIDNMIKVNEFIYRTSLMNIFYDIGRIIKSDNFNRVHVYCKHKDICILLDIQDMSDIITNCNGDTISITSYECSEFDMDSSKIKTEQSILDLKSQNSTSIIKTERFSQKYYFDDNSRSKVDTFLQTICNIKLEGPDGKSVF